MPIYEYQCKACQHQFDTLQSFSDEPLLECPTCHKPELHKLISAPAFQLKGSGWYVTDFKNGNKKASGAGNSEATDKQISNSESDSKKTVSNKTDST